MTLRTSHLWLIPFVLIALTVILPLPRFFAHPAAEQAVQILDRNGKLLYEVRPEESGSHQFLALAEMPRPFIDAVLAIEDRDFYKHGGISFKAIARAAYQNVSEGQIISGGSTISQQLVRNRLQPRRRSFLYKAWEAFLAMKLDGQLSKDEILESYLNTSYYGHQAYGFAAAAKTYFGKSPHELSVAESALLAGVLQSPSALDPFLHPEAAKKRRALVLAAMQETQAITDDQYQHALTEPIELGTDTVSIEAPHFVFWMQETRPDLFTGASRVHTTLDLDLQRQVERIVEQKLKDLADKNVTSSAVVVLDAHKGDVLAMVGSADYFDRENEGAVNVAVSPRQPGSALKPFTYALALERGDTPATTVSDTEAQFLTGDGNPYTPRNYDFGFHGLVRYREALANSYNIAAVKVLQRVGVPVLLGFLRDAGITSLTQTPEYYGLALTLGDPEVSLIDLATAYAIFPRAGRTLTLRTSPGDPILPGHRILSEQSAWLISDILSDNAARMKEFGPDSSLAFSFPVAAKTGTTRNSRDNWTVGYTPDVIVGVWVGNADNAPMQGTSGVTGAGPIFHDVMLAATGLYPPRPFLMPTGITRETICMLSGKLPTPECPHTITEYFAAGTKPREKDDMYRSFTVDARNGLLASPACDPKYVTHKTFAVFPPETRQWAREHGWPQPPTDTSPLCGGAGDSQTHESREGSWLAISQPQAGDAFLLDPLVPDAHEAVIFEAQASDDIRTVTWFINGVPYKDAVAPDFRAEWTPKPGRFVIEAAGGNLRKTVMIDVSAGPAGAPGTSP